MKLFFLFALIFVSNKLMAQATRPSEPPASIFTTQDLREEVRFKHNPYLASGVAQCPADKPIVELDKLEILGARITSIASLITIEACVMATTDSAARSACRPHYNVLNPGNPQYSDELDQVSTNLSRNQLGYYYCIPKRYSMPRIKRDRCEELIRTPTIARDFNIEFDTRTGDGSCWVRDRSVPNSPRQLHNDRLEQAVREARWGPISVISDESLAINTVPLGNVLSDINFADVTVSPDVASSQVEGPINTCITRWRERANSCKTGAEQTLQTCSEDRTETRANAINGTGIKQVYSQAASELLRNQDTVDRQRDTCTQGASFCQTSCDPEIVDQQFIDDCMRDAQQTNYSTFSEQNSELARTLQTAKTEIKDLFQEGHQICRAQVPSRQLRLDSLVSSLGQALRIATIGACKSDSTAGQNCDAIPAIDACQNNPATPGCGAYQPIAANCSVGSPNYNQQACSCSRNPSGPNCANPIAANVVSNFGGANLPQASGGGASSFASTGGGGGSGGGSGSFGDLSNGGGGGSAAPANFAGNLKAGEISTGGAASGASVGGGGNGAASPAGAPQAAAPVAEKGIGALFKDLKNVVTSAFGGGSNKASPKAAGNVAVNADRFKPQMQGQLRGGPQRRDIASANEKTLFELVNECANGLRCKMPGDSYLVNP